jgi:predicted permease
MIRWTEDLVRDVRHGARRLLEDKAYSIAAIAALSLGIGGTAAIFSVLNGLILRPLPFDRPERLVQVYGTSRLNPTTDAVNNLAAVRAQATSFDALAGYEVSAGYLTTGASVDRVMTVRAEPDFFRVLGVPAKIGRTFGRDEPANVAVVSETFWLERLKGEPVIGRVIPLDGQAITIVGVMPASFQFPYGAGSLLPGVASEARTDVWIDWGPVPSRGRVGHVTGRLRSGVDLRTAQSELSVVASRLEMQFPESNGGRGLSLVPLADAVIGPAIRRSLFLLVGAVGLVLAIACANVTNLSLVRMTLRSREVAIRDALGAGRRRLARQFFTESMVLALAGGAIGLVVAWWGTGRVLQLAGISIPRSHEVVLDWRVFTFLAAICGLAGASIGLVPALVNRANVQQLLKAGGQSTMALEHRRLRDAVVALEIALAFLLAVGAALLVRELDRLRHTDTGMVTGRVITFHLGQRVPRPEPSRFYEIEDRVAQLPGVRAVGLTQLVPLQNWGWTSNSTDFAVRARPAPGFPQFPIELRFVSPGYFRALGIPVLRGRTFTRQDNRESPVVVVINEALARKYFDTEDPVGLETTRGTIVGVVRDVRQIDLDRPAAPELYYAIAQNWSQVSELGMSLVASLDDRAPASTDDLRRIVSGISPSAAIFNVKTMNQIVEDSLGNFTLYLILVASFAGLALVLVAVGIYGMISFLAASRAREHAIRLALGAGRAHVAVSVIGLVARLTAIGVAGGMAAVYLTAPLARNLPVGIRPPTIGILLAVAAGIAVVATIACLGPALRAAARDPIVALRND